MDLIETLIGDFHERPLPALTEREIVLPTVPDKAVVVIGMRRSGKTFTLFQEMERLLRDGLDKRHILYLNLEDDRLGEPDLSTLDRVLETYYRMNPEARSSGAHLFFDEIQTVEGWARFGRRVLDTESARLFVSGSSAKLLSTEVSTEFRGRGYAVEVLPFSFRESVRHAEIELPASTPGARKRSQLENHLRSYLEVGGFPEVQGLDVRVRIQILQDYVELVLLRDVIERHRITNVPATRAFAAGLLQNTGNLFSVNKAYRDMKSRGIDVGKDTLYGLLDILEDSYLAFNVSVFRSSHRARQAVPKKVYAVDPGLALAVSHVAAEDLGARLETAVYLELRRRFGRAREGTISYYVTSSGREVDFVMGDPEVSVGRSLFQVCADISDEETRDREVRGLREAMAELGLREATIVTLDTSEELTVDEGVIQITPAWAWMSGY